MIPDEIERFTSLNTLQQIKFIKEGEFVKGEKKAKIEFLKTILKEDLSSKVVASSLKILRELKYRDKYFFRKFLYHIDSSVANAAKKAISLSVARKDSKEIKIVDLIKNERESKKIAMVKTALKEMEKSNVNLIINLLNLENVKIREYVIKEASVIEGLDEAKLSKALLNSVWYVRSAIIEILGNRRSSSLFNYLDLLLKDKNVEVKLKLIEALAKNDREKVKDYLQKMKNDSHIWIRKEAERVLLRI